MAVAKNFRQKKLVNFLEWVAACFVLIFSGNSGWTILTKGGLVAGGPKGIITTLFFLYLWYMKSDKKFRANALILAYVISAWFSLCDFFGNGISTRALGPAFTAFQTYLLASVTDFKDFREKIRRVLTWICTGTVITYALYMTTGLWVTSRHGSMQVFFLFRIWGGNRAAAIYQEPGQFQITIFFVLLLFTDELVKFSMSRIHYYIKKFGMILAALLVAQSSMGYICLMVYAGLLFVFNKSAKHNVITYILMLALGVVAVMFLWQTDTIQNKIDPRNMLYRRSSLAERVNDSITLYNMSLIQPLTGLGGRSPDYYRLANNWGGFPVADGINGWLNLAVCYGWPFFFLIVISILFGLKRMKPGIPPLVLFSVLLLSQADETNAIHYLTFLYVFPFNSYDRQEIAQ